MTNFELQSPYRMSATMYDGNAGVWFLGEPTQQLWIFLSYFNVCDDTFSQLAAVGRLQLTPNNRHDCKSSVDEYSNTPSACHCPIMLPRTQCSITLEAIPILNYETSAVNGHGVETLDIHHVCAFTAILVQRPIQ